MKVRNTGAVEEKIEVPMTPMIDIVFQLLVFFIMTFKIVELEGDFNIKMPLAAPKEGLPDENLVPPMKLKLAASADGSMASMRLNEKPFGNWTQLRDYMINFIGDARGPGSIQETAEVELDCDFNLRYEETINAVTAVSGFKDDEGNVIKLVEKIKFTPPKTPPGG